MDNAGAFKTSDVIQLSNGWLSNSFEKVPISGQPKLPDDLRTGRPPTSRPFLQRICP
jgi:hypothetical protein